MTFWPECNACGRCSLMIHRPLCWRLASGLAYWGRPFRWRRDVVRRRRLGPLPVSIPCGNLFRGVWPFLSERARWVRSGYLSTYVLLAAGRLWHYSPGPASYQCRGATRVWMSAFPGGLVNAVLFRRHAYGVASSKYGFPRSPYQEQSILSLQMSRQATTVRTCSAVCTNWHSRYVLHPGDSCSWHRVLDRPLSSRSGYKVYYMRRLLRFA